jgi:glycosidase
VVKKANVALSKGKYVYVESNNKDVFSFYRIDKNQRVLVTVNLSNKTQIVKYNNNMKAGKNLLNKNKKFQKTMELKPYEIGIWM